MKIQQVVICQNLYRSFGTITAVNNLSFSVPFGTTFGLMGPNGAGKTTTLRIISGILPPTRGKCEVASYDVYSQRKHVKKVTGLLPESSGIYQSLTAREFLLFIGSLYKIPMGNVKNKIDYYFDLLDFKDEKIILSDLSRGQRQKTMFIASVINDPKVLLLDEPIATLDPFVAHRLKNHIKKLAKDRVILVSSHNANLIDELCDEVLFISKGSTIAIDTPANLKSTFKVDTLEECYLSAIGG